MKIVAPAGNMERFYSAISATADEIYLGLKGFGARRNAENFTVEELKQAIDYAHLRGSRIFLTLNTIMTNREIELLYPTLKDLYNYGLDAIIVQDIGYAEYLHKNFPNIEIHGSTQMTVANYYEINYLKELGFKRIVLPRELSFEEIKEIRKNTDMELEVFVSISFSGNCYMSSFIGGRSGNRGMCAQPCRKEYKTSCGEKSYFLSPKDQLYGLDEIKKLQEIGVESIKVEGRMKDVSYVYETVSYFRNLINGIDKEENTPKLFNRGYSKGYFYDNDKSIMNRDYSYNMGEKIGEVVGKSIRLDEDVVSGDGITFVSKDYKNLGGTYIGKINVANIKEDRKIAYKNEKLILNFPDGTKYIFRNLKNLKRNAVEKFREEILSYFRRDLDSELKENNQEYFKLEIEKDEPKDLEIRVIVSNEEQKSFLENIKDEYNIKEIYYRTYDIAKQSMLGQHNLDNKLASNLYELLENKNSTVMLNWNMNIVNSYTINVLEKIKKLESFIVSPEINFSKIRELGKTRLKKALLIYSKLKGMTIDIDIADNKNEVITNKENDKFNIIKNEYGTEIFLDKPLNIINIMENIKKLNVDIVVLEFTTETIEDIKKVLKQLKTRKGEYREYNYKRGVY